MKVTITIEKFDNGISFRCFYPESEENTAKVALDSQKEIEIGKQIWENIKDVMKDNSCNVVDIYLEYKPI